ncbi:hypothetical protein [Methanosarcina sp. DH2]|nr:hypothetical protein [Methanosarcina sp. DH2]
MATGNNAIPSHLPGRQKNEVLKKNPGVCFEATIETEIITAEGPAS